MENFGSLTFLTWLHEMATIAWFGGMITNYLILMPSMSKALDPPTTGKLMAVLMKRFKIVVYSSLLILLFTGFAISGLSDTYADYYASNEGETNYYLIKHLLIVVLAILTVISFELVAPMVAKVAAQGPSPKLAKMQARQKILAMLGFLCALVIVLLSVMMSISGS